MILGQNILFISWAKAPALYVTMSQEVVVVVEVHFLDLAFRAQIELRNVKVKVLLRKTTKNTFLDFAIRA